MADHGKKSKETIVNVRHPEWARMSNLWERWRLTYEGGEDFIDKFLIRLSKREAIEDFEDRRAITYNENHAGGIIDIIRNAMSVKLPEVSRKGDGVYETLMKTDVDMMKSSMNTFIGLEVVPLLLAQGKRFIGVDAPQILDIAGVRTLATDEGRPYVWAIDAENVLSWAYDDMGRFASILIAETVDVVDGATGLVKGIMKQFRYMRVLVGSEDKDVATGKVGPGVLVRVLDEDAKDMVEAQVLDISRIPIVELRLVDSLISDIADMQISHLNLSSTDMSFLLRGNFPIYIEQQDEAEASLKPLGSEAQVQSFDQEISDPDRILAETERENRRSAGPQSGIGYKSGLNPPTFIAPTVDNLKVSMEKQSKLAQSMRALVNLSLVSLSVRAVEQSGKSKEADRIGEEAALTYIALVLETGEREVTELFHEFLNSASDFEVRYPEGFSIKTQDERRAEVKELRELRSSVPSETYAKTMDERIVEVSLKPIATSEQMAKALQEVKDADYFDDDEIRQRSIERDVQLGILSKATGAKLRGHNEEEPDLAMAEKGAEADMISGGIVVPPDDGGTE